MSKDPIRLRLTVSVEYVADPDRYPGLTSSDDMAAVDEKYFAMNELAILETLAADGFYVKVAPVVEGGERGSVN